MHLRANLLPVLVSTTIMSVIRKVLRVGEMKLQRIVNLAAIVVTIAVLSMADAVSIVPNSVIEAQSVCENGVAVPDPTNNPGLVSDCEALLAARDTLADTGSLDWADTAPVAEWEGITVGGTPERVTELYLLGRKINGEISPELGNLTGLKSLRLVFVLLRGGIPAELGNLSNLRRLTIVGTELSGVIPAELGSLTNLERLFLAGNHLSGELPASFTGLTKLESLNFVNSSGICAPIDEAFQEWLDGVDLVRGSSCATVDFADDRAVLMAFRNGIGGGRSRLTDWGSNKLMREWRGVTTDADGRVNWLELNIFSLQGTLSPRLGELAELEGLHLQQNSFSGAIPIELGNLANLRFLDLSQNQLDGGIPSELGNLDSLEELFLLGNQLTGEVPSEMGNLANLDLLNLSVNLLTGEIPSEMGSLSNLVALGLAANRLTGEIPSELGNLSSLTILLLGDNRLTGEIPSELGNLSELTRLTLADNRLTGCIPLGLQDVADNDFDDVGLPFCEEASPGNPSLAISTISTFIVRFNTPIQVTATFSAPVTGFTPGDITVSNGEASNFAGGDGDSVYTFDVTPDAIGDVTVDIAADVAEDGDSDGNVAAIQLSLGIPYDDDHDGAINRAEVITAIGDYLFGGLLTRGQVIELIGLYLFG